MTPYELLKVPTNITEEELKIKYRKLVLKYHPDRNNGSTTELFKKIINAYEAILIDIKKRSEHKKVQDRMKYFEDMFYNPTTTESTATFTTEGVSFTFTMK